MTRVAVDDTLARAWAELHAGQTAAARNRLQGLVGSHPARLDVRVALAATYRADGDAAQAGRWSYLDPRAPRTEVVAFLAAYPDPVARMKALRWAGPEDAAGKEAAARLAELRTAAELATGGTVDWSGRRTPGRRPRTQEDPWSVDRGCFLWTAVLCVSVVGAATAASRRMVRPAEG